MALVIHDNKKEIKYIPISERAEDKPFTIWFTPLSSKQLANLEDGYLLIRGEDAISLQTGTYNMKAVQAALSRWDNISTDKGIVSIEKDANGMVTEATIDYIPSSILTELGTVIINVSKFPDDAELYLGMAGMDTEITSK